MNIEELKAKALAATPGPWIADQYFVGTTYGRHNIVSGASEKQMSENAEFIAAANPAAILDLIAELEEVKDERDALHARIEAAENQEPYCYDSCGDLIYRKEDGLKSPNPIALYALPPMPAQQQTYTVKVYNKGGSGEFKRLEGIEALEDGQKLIAIESGNGE